MARNKAVEAFGKDLRDYYKDNNIDVVTKEGDVFVYTVSTLYTKENRRLNKELH